MESTIRKRAAAFALAYIGGAVSQAIIYTAIMYRYFESVDGEYVFFGFLAIALLSVLAGLIGLVLCRCSRLATFALGALLGPIVGVLYVTLAG
jgi:hypothetical protein